MCDLMKCYYCGKEIKKGDGRHLKKCLNNYFLQLSEERKTEIIEKYRAGASMVDMSKFLGVPYSAAEKLLNLLGERRRSVKEATNLESCRSKYGDTMEKKYGTRHNFDKNNPSRKKWEERLFKEEGITNVFQRESVKEKIKETLHEKYTDEEIYYNYIKGSTLEYWVNKLGEEEGVKKYNEICYNKGKSSRIEYYIEKYGEIDSQRIYAERIQKSLRKAHKSLLNKRCEEILKKHNIVFEKEFLLRYESNDTSRRYFYDFKIGNLILELNGLYWHCSPKKYKADDMVKFPNNIYIKAKDKWEYDKNKCDYAKSKGYDVVIIWEDEFNENFLLEILRQYNYGTNCKNKEN